MNFEELYKSTFSGLYRFFYYKSVDQSQIEDLVQEVYIRLYNRNSEQDTFDVEAQKLLYGIAKNVYKEWVRKSIKENSVSFLDNYEYEDTDNGGDILDVIAGYEDTEFDKNLELQRKLLLQNLDSLNENVREVLKLRFIEGMSRKEVSERLGIKEKDVHTYQKRGIKYLRKIMINNEE